MKVQQARSEIDGRLARGLRRKSASVLLRTHIRKMTGPAKLSKHAGCGLIQACSRWLIAVVAADPAHAEVRAAADRNWQSRRLPDNLRQEIMPKLIIQKRGNRIVVNLQRGESF